MNSCNDMFFCTNDIFLSCILSIQKMFDNKYLLLNRHFFKQFLFCFTRDSLDKNNISFLVSSNWSLSFSDRDPRVSYKCPRSKLYIFFMITAPRMHRFEGSLRPNQTINQFHQVPYSICLRFSLLSYYHLFHKIHSYIKVHRYIPHI